MLKNIEIIKPELIEKRSFEIIESEMSKEALKRFDDKELKVVKRCIHTAADFDYQDNLVFHKDALNVAFSLCNKGTIIVTDTTMAMAGINKRALESLGIEVKNFISDEEIVKEAKEKGLTRSYLSMEKALNLKVKQGCKLICAIGNAPTALISIYEIYKRTQIKPDFIIAAPVGFVNVVEAKELILSLDIPMIVARGRKGGSNICAAIVNAIIYQFIERQKENE